MLLGGIGILSAVIAAVSCAVSGGFGDLSWIWMLPVIFVGSYLGLFLLANSVKCRAFIRYYYSPYFAKYSAAEHRERFDDFLERFKVCFKEEANVWMILNHILDTMLSFAVKVFDGALADSPDTEEHVFRLVYASSQQYFKDENSQDTIKE